MKKLLSAVSLIGIVTTGTLFNGAYADVAANTLPQFKNGTNVDVKTTGNNMNIKITDENQYAVGTANWHSFNIGKDAGVNVEFTAHNQTSLNYVDAAGGMSQIYGKFTDSGCYNCGYEGTGKVILLNPNGVLFGNGANVNLNSFTATTMNGVYDKNNRTLKLTKTGKANEGIVVQDGAKIYGDKGVTFASENINIYKGSQISTNTGALNVDSNGDKVKENALGKVKLVTADGVTFSYYNNAAVNKVDDIKTSTDKMTLWIGGDITSGHIHAENASSHVDSEVNTNGATLKAYKAEKGNDGNIWLKAQNRVITEKTNMNTYNYTSGAASRSGGNIKIESNNKSTLNNNVINAVGNVDVITHSADGKAYTDHYGVARTNDGNVNVDNTQITAKDITLDSVNISSIQNGSVVNGNNVTVKGANRGQIVSSNVTAAKDINVQSGSGLAWTANATLNAGQDINIASTNGGALLQNTTHTASRNIKVNAYGDVSSNGSNLTAQDVEIASSNGSIGLQNTKVKATSGNVKVNAYNNVVTSDASELTAAQNLEITAANGSALLQNTTNKATNGYLKVTSKNDISSDNLANSTFTAGKDVNVTSTSNSIYLNGTEQFKPGLNLNLKAAKDVYIAKDDALTVKNVNIDAGNDVLLQSKNATLTVDSTTKFANAKNIYLQGGQDVLTNGTVDLNNLKGNIQAGKNVNVTLANVGNADKGLVAIGGNDVTVTTPGTLSVAYLKSGNDMTINANKVIKGKEYMTDPTLPTSSDTTSRSYIEVGGENFNSNVASGDYQVTASAYRTNDNKYNQKHHIQYGDEKIYLSYKLPVPNDTTPADIEDPNNGKEKDVLDPDSTSLPTIQPTVQPTVQPTIQPTVQPTVQPTEEPVVEPTKPTTQPTVEPTCNGTPAAGDDIQDEEYDF